MYALEAGFSPVEDSLLLEGAESPYANIIAVKSGDESKEDIQKLLKALQSKKEAECMHSTHTYL